jgi:predicted ATPase
LFDHWPTSRIRRRPLPQTWSVGNFKPIELARANLKRLSVLAGANSSGKSSLIQSLLFLSQSVAEGEPLLNGALVGLGSPADAIRDGENRSCR